MKPPVKILSKSTPVKSIIRMMNKINKHNDYIAFAIYLECLETILDELPLEARHYELLGIKTLDFYPNRSAK